MHSSMDYPEERITVQFLDAPDLNTTVTNCTDQVVDLSIETHVPYMTQHISIPLSQVEVAEDFSHYTRDPDPVVKPEKDPLVYEMWLTGEVDHGPVEERGAAEGLLLEELQRRGPQKRSGNKRLKKNVSK